MSNHYHEQSLENPEVGVTPTDVPQNSTDSLADEEHAVTALVADDAEPPSELQLQIERSNEINHVKKPLQIVPRSMRRGLLSSFSLVPECTDARDLSNRSKGYIVFVVSVAAMIAPMGGSIILPALTEVASDLHSTPNIINVSYGVYTLSLGIFPLWWSGLSEFNGRRTVYVLSFALFVAFQIGCALCKNIASLMIFRVLAGGAAASVQAVGAGTIGDVFIVTERGRAMGYFYLGPLCGPLLAPIIGGAIAIKWGWRGTQWFLVILGGVTLCLIVFGLPETLARTKKLALPPPNNGLPDEDVAIVDPLGPVDSRRSSRSCGRHRDNDVDSQIHTATASHHNLHHFIEKFHFHHHKREGTDSSDEKERIGRGEVYKRILWHPLKSFKIFRYPPLPLTVCFSAYCFFCLYFLNIGIQELYSESPYNFSPLLVGLTYIPNSVGYIISSIGNGYWSDRIIARSIKKHGKVVPEDRLGENVYIAIVMFPISLFVFAWTAHAKVIWVAPLVGTFVFGMASMVVFGNTMTYMVDSLPGKGATGVALNNFVRMVLAAVATFVIHPLRVAIGYGWLFTMLALGTSFSWICLFIIKKRGPKWRETYDIREILG